MTSPRPMAAEVRVRESAVLRWGLGPVFAAIGAGLAWGLYVLSGQVADLQWLPFRAVLTLPQRLPEAWAVPVVLLVGGGIGVAIAVADAHDQRGASA